MLRIACCLTVLLSQSALAEVPAPDIRDLVNRNTYTFSYTDAALDGPGAAHLRRQVADAQFVLLGEEHMDHAIPIFSGALYKTLHDSFGYRHLVVEQDPVAIEDALQPALRGDVDRIAAHAKRYPTLFEFDTDEDLGLLALVGTLEGNADAIWGVEQTTGAIRYLEELSKLAPDAAARSKVEQALVAARAADHEPKYSVNWLIAATTPAQINGLTEAFGKKPQLRAAVLLRDLAKSSEIFGYYRRAEAGEFVGLYNNTVREEVLKRNFLDRYLPAAKSAAAKGGSAPKAMFKFGSNHLYHGKNPTQAFPIGNLAHELAIVNGSRAYGLYVVAIGENYVSYKDFPNWMLPLLPAEEPKVPTLIDLRPLRPFQRPLREKVEVASQWEMRALLHGYDAIVILPGSKPAVRKLGGRGN